MAFAQELKTMLEYSDYNHQNLNLLKQEIEMVHQMYPSLNLASGWGSKSEHTVALVGTIPIDFQGAVYNIPFAISYPVSYPDSAPLCKVTPTDSFLIKTSETIDEQGNVSIKLLKNWDKFKDSLDVIQNCTQEFSLSPPIYDIGKFYVNEMAKIKSQIDELLSDKRNIKRINEQVQDSIREIKNIDWEKKLKILENQVNVVEKWVQENSNSNDINLDNAFHYKSLYSKNLLEVMAEEESCEDVSRKLTDAFYLKAIQPSEFFTKLKQIYNDRFMLMKKREKILKIMQ